MNQSNFLIIFFICVLELHTRIVSAARLTPYPRTPANISDVPEEEQEACQVVDEEEPTSRRHDSSNIRELLDIKQVNQNFININPDIPVYIRPVPLSFRDSGFPNSTAQTVFELGMRTPPPNITKKQPSSTDSNNSVSSASSSNSTTSSFTDSSSMSSFSSFPRFSHDQSSNNFNPIFRHAATLSSLGGNSFFGPEIPNEKYKPSTSLIFSTAEDHNPPNFMGKRHFKTDEKFMNEMDSHGLSYGSSELESELGEEEEDMNGSDDNLGTEYDDDGGSRSSSSKVRKQGDFTGTSSSVSSYRSDSATSELGKRFASHSIDHVGYDHMFEHLPDSFGPIFGDFVVLPQKPIENPPFEVEYGPWLPESEDGDDTSYLYRSFDNLKSDFDLQPLSDQVETVESPETEVGRNYFRHGFKPFQDYGEFVYDKDQLRAAVEIAKPSSERVAQQMDQRREQTSKRRGREVKSVRHAEALEYAKLAALSKLIESEWIYKIINGGTIDFLSYFEEIDDTEELQNWTVKRCAEFIVALIPSVMFSSNFEEVLIDFFDDFFIPQILPMENEKLTSTSDQIKLVNELVTIGKEMIKHSISHTIIENFLRIIQDLFTDAESEKLYETLVDTMNKFKIPKPFVSNRVAPSLDDEKYSEISDKEERESTFQADLDKHKEKVMREERKARYQEDLIRVKHIHKARSFETLRILVSLFPGPIMRPDSRWCSGNYLRMPRYIANAEDFFSSTTEEGNHESSKRKKKKKLVDQKLFGEAAHENQDFFDALFFSRILRACLVQEDIIELVANVLDPFLRSYQITIPDSPLSFRYLKVVDKFINITKFNVVANVPPPIINYRRYLIAYLIRNGANWMGIVPSKVQSRAIAFEFLSLFEAVHLYQVVDPSNAQEREKRMKILISTKEIDYKIPIIYYCYNPILYSSIARIIEEVSMEDLTISISKLNGYYEIFAMAKNVDLLPIYDRKVLKFKYIEKSLEDPVVGLQSNNENLEFRRPLPEPYEAVFIWNMSRRLKNLSESGNHLNYPYGTFASRIVLARRFGVSFDASNFIPQLSENFTWTECVDFINFFLEREAQLLIERSNNIELDSDLYQVYRVEDSQEHLHKIRQLSSDEPTHHLNLLIESALNGLPKEEAQLIRSIYSRHQLFNLFKQALGKVEPVVLLALSREESIKILYWLLDDKNIPVTFDFSMIE